MCGLADVDRENYVKLDALVVPFADMPLKQTDFRRERKTDRKGVDETRDKYNHRINPCASTPLGQSYEPGLRFPCWDDGFILMSAGHIKLRMRSEQLSPSVFKLTSVPLER